MDKQESFWAWQDARFAEWARREEQGRLMLTEGELAEYVRTQYLLERQEKAIFGAVAND